MLNRVKKFLTANPEGKRITHYVEVFGATFGLAAIASAEHVESLHQPITTSVIAGVAVAGLKAVIDLAKPLIVGLFTNEITKS